MEKLRKHTLYVGLLDQFSYKQEVATEDAKSIINKAIGDCTISDATGYYTHSSNGKQITEPSLRVEVLFKTDAEVFSACKTIKKALNQESIGLTSEVIYSSLV